MRRQKARREIRSGKAKARREIRRWETKSTENFQHRAIHITVLDVDTHFSSSPKIYLGEYLRRVDEVEVEIDPSRLAWVLRSLDTY